MHLVHRNKNMEALRIQATVKTPEVLFDPANEVFEIKGKSIPDDAEHPQVHRTFYLDLQPPNDTDNPLLKAVGVSTPNTISQHS